MVERFKGSLRSDPDTDHFSALVDDFKKATGEIDNEANDSTRGNRDGPGCRAFRSEPTFLLGHANRIGDALRREAGSESTFKRCQRIDSAATSAHHAARDDPAPDSAGKRAAAPENRNCDSEAGAEPDSPELMLGLEDLEAVGPSG